MLIRSGRNTVAALIGLVGLIGLAAMLASCGKAEPAATSGVDLSGAWARATAAGATNGAAYLTISAHQADRLVSARVDPSVAASTELHQMVMADGTPAVGSSGSGGSAMSMPGMDMSGGKDAGDGATAAAPATGAMVMRPVPGGLAVPSGRDVVLAPGGYHLMLLALARPLAPGDTFELTLTFQRAGDQTVRVEVRNDAP